MRSRRVSRVISVAPDVVYAFARDPDNLPRWAAGLASSQVTRSGDELLVTSPMGRVTVRFAPHNAYGVLDHDVTVPSGETVSNPMRVVAHPDGAEIVFTIRQRGLTDAEFDRDSSMVEADLQRLKELLEQASS